LSYFNEIEKGIKSKTKTKSICNYDFFNIFYQLLNAIQEMHENNIVHRDIKLENIFLDIWCNAYIGDFGYSTTCSEYKNNETVGTVDYLPVYINKFKNKQSISKKLDIFSLSMILFLYSSIIADEPYNFQEKNTSDEINYFYTDEMIEEDKKNFSGCYNAISNYKYKIRPITTSSFIEISGIKEFIENTVYKARYAKNDEVFDENVWDWNKIISSNLYKTLERI